MAKARIAIFGAGPVGLEAAVQAHRQGLPFTVFEQAGAVAAHLDRWAFVRMFTPFGMNVSQAGREILLREAPMREFPADDVHQTGGEFKTSYLIPLASSAALKPRIMLDSRIIAVGREAWRKTDVNVDPRKPLPPFRILVRDSKGVERFEFADVIFDCTGVLGRPNWLGDGAIPAAGEIAARPQLSYWVEDVLGARRAVYAGKTTVVIGAGYSAATMVCDLVTLAEADQSTWIVWLTHGPKTSPLPRLANDPLKERDRLAAKANHIAARCDGNLEYHAQAVVEECLSLGQDKGFKLTVKIAGKPMVYEPERVIATVGYRPDTSLTAELRDPEPNYFLLGSKALGRDSRFLIQDAQDQLRKAFAQLKT
ncbi:MAG: monooxygenase [Fimbriiglobus sp.]